MKYLKEFTTNLNYHFIDIFIPLIVKSTMNPKEETRRISKFTNVVYLITTLIIVLSTMFKIMHWQYSEELGILRNIAFITAFAVVLYENTQLKKIIKR